jgi:hypothetical protein
MQAHTLDELALLLAHIARERGDRGDRNAYFAALYGLMTASVRDGVTRGRFRDPARMERLACHFAGRYLSALDRYERHEPAPRCWTVAFHASRESRPIILQHLMLGMNAHINFDLGISAAEVAAGAGLDAVRQDFLEINAVLAELLEDVQDRIASVSPWMGILDLAGGRKDETYVNFSMTRARDAAWQVAERFIGLDGDAFTRAETALDAQFASFARTILRPGILISVASLPVRLRERATVAEVVDAFRVLEPVRAAA